MDKTEIHYLTLDPDALWRRMTQGEEHIHRLDSVSKVLKFAAVCFVSAVLSGIGVGLIVYFNFGVDGLRAGLFVFLNNFDISLVLGCPLMILSNQIISRRSGSDREVTTNEKIILASALAEIAGLGILIVTMCAKGFTVGVYDTWNSIYLFALVLINTIMLAALVTMVIAEK